MGALPGYFYSTSKDGLYVNLYGDSALDWHLEDGTGIKVEQKTNYPWEGGVDLRVSPAEAKEFTLFLRVPGWAPHVTAGVNGQPWKESLKPGSYAALRRQWKAGDRVHLEFDMTPQFITANPNVMENVGKVAVQRGPIVYTLEQLDQGGDASVFDVAVLAGRNSPKDFKVEFRQDLLGGVTVLRHRGVTLESSPASSALYGPLGSEARKHGGEIDLTFIPYYAWANRQPDAMRVWLPYVNPGAGKVAHGGR
jgi:DUF1680 family protein